MIKHNLSPSLIARFFYHNCERYLRFHATPLQMRSKAGIPVVNQNQSPVTKALLEAGNKWEESVILNKLKNNAINNVITPAGEGALHERSHPVEASLEIFSKLKTGDAVYQPTILVSPRFYQKYHLSPEICRFSACRPDLVRVVEKERGVTCLQVIDVKASEELSSSHRIQATLYALMMKDVLEKNNIDTQVDLNQAGIWLNRKDGPELFNLNFNTKIIEEFLHYRLPEILQSPLESVPWHVYNRCELCDFYQYCRKEAEESNSVSLVPYLSVSGRKYLREAEWDHKTSINSLSELEAFLDKKEADDILSNCGSLRNKGDSLRNTLKALKEKEVIVNKGTSLSLPKNEDVSLFITLQKDPVSGQIYAAGFRRFKGKAIYGDAVNERIYVAESPEKCAEIQRNFLLDLLRELRILHEYNESLEWKEQKSLQTYVYDSYELDLLRELFRESVKITELAPAALDLLFYFQDSSLFNEKRHPLFRTSFPIIVLTGEIQKLVSLPVPFSLRLPEVVEVLPGPGLDFKINPSSLFWFEHSNALKSDAISMAWESNRTEAIDWIRKELSIRLLAASSVLEGLRAKVEGSLVSWPPRFQIPAYKKYNYPEVSQMIFITRYESYMRNMEIREKRSLPFDGRVKEGISVPIQYLEQNLWKVSADVDSRSFEQNENISYLLVPEGEAGEKAQITFDDYKYRTNLRNPSQRNVCFAMVNKKIENEKTGKLMGFFLEVSYNEGHLPFKTGDKAVLHPRFTDFSSERIINRLIELDEQLEHDFIRLLRDPHKFAVPIREPNAFSEAAQKYAVESGFTESQKRAFEHMINNRLTLIWGPPGTGKTYFLARAILNFVKAKMDQGEKIHVAVTAFTHSAIENLLIKIQELSYKLKFGSGLEIYKLKELKTGKGQELLKVQSEYEIQDRFDSRFLILGGTVNSFNKINRKMNPFDILIVDEASQMKPAELALGMSVLGEGKRLVLAGDDLQLPPIIAGDYPETEGGIPGLYDSIFSYLRNRDDIENPKYTCQLLENWRMNETLSGFSSHTLYGEGYRPATEEIAKQKLNILPSNTNSEILPGEILPEAKQEEVDQKADQKTDQKAEADLVNWALDPAYPLTVIILENTQATIENEIEAELVAKLAVHLRQTLSRDDADSPYPDSEAGDSDFWKSGLFIVSPHRAQIRTIQTHLNRLRKWRTRPFVDTVDKTQGQEAEAVIVSYGVSDTDTAMNEAEFIYSLNRLNVSVTRAKSKCVVFLPRPLLEPPMEILQNKKAAEGFNHMLELVEFCRREGEERGFEVEMENYGEKVKLSGIR